MSELNSEPRTPLETIALNSMFVAFVAIASVLIVISLAFAAIVSCLSSGGTNAYCDPPEAQT